MDISQALALSLGSIEEPVITRYRIGQVMHRLFLKREFEGEPLSGIVPGHSRAEEFQFRMEQLSYMGILKSHPNFPNKVFRLLGRKDEKAEEVACTVDPFCYLSHLSAMAYHGVTDRLPIKLFISSPAPRLWKEEADGKMRKELGDFYGNYIESGMPHLSRMNLSKIGKMDVHRFSSIHRGAYINVKGRTLRVASIGRTFLDMLRNPELCGGMRHVMEVFENYASVYLSLIVDEVDRNGSPVDKVRAGYLLDEKLGLGNDVVEGWLGFVQRGGSRKLDASGEYVPFYSEKWMLSLNVE